MLKPYWKSEEGKWQQKRCQMYKCIVFDMSKSMLPVYYVVFTLIAFGRTWLGNREHVGVLWVEQSLSYVLHRAANAHSNKTHKIAAVVT